MKLKRFFRSAAFLAAAGMVAKVIGAAYKVPMVAVLGAEGIGIYQLVFPLYTTLLTLSGGGIPLAVSRTVAAFPRADGRGEGRILVAALLAFVPVGALGTAALALLGGGMACAQGNPDATAAYVALAPSVCLVSVLAVLRGWWQGTHDMFPTALSQLIEQSVKLLAGLALAQLFAPFGRAYAVAGAVAGISVSELVAVVALVLLTVMRRREISPAGRPLFRTAVREMPVLWSCALPVSLGSLVLPLIGLVDSALVVNLLTDAGMSAGEATALFGAAASPSAVLSLPTVLTGAACSAALPALTAARAAGKENGAASDRAMRAAHFAGVGGAAFIALFADDIVGLLFAGGLTDAERAVAVSVLRLSAAGVPYVCYTQTITTVLQSRGHTALPALCLLAGGVVKTVLTLLLVPRVGVAGTAYSAVAAYAFTFALDALAVRKVSFAVRPLVNALLACGCAAAVSLPLTALPLSGVFALTLPPLVFALVYVALPACTGATGRAAIAALREKFARYRGLKKTKKY